MSPMNTTIIDRQKLDAAYVTFSTLFDMQLTRTPTIFQDIATVIPVGSAEVSFKWLGDVPKMTEWIGQRAINKLQAEQHRIVTKDWANGIEVSRDDLADDKLGMIEPRIGQLADEGMWAMEDLVLAFYNDAIDGTLGLAYDGQPMLDTAHTASGAGGTAQSNLQASTLQDLAEDAYQDAWSKMMGFVDTKGNSIRVVPDTLLTGVANRTLARKLLQQQTQASGAQNIEFGTTRLIVSPRITGAKWFLISTQQRIRPVILLVRQAAQFAAVDSFDDAHAFMTATFLYGADARFGAGIGLWQTVVGSDGVD